MLKEIKSFSEEFFNKINIDIDFLEVVLEAEDTFFIKVNTPDSSIAIWNHGINFEAIQYIFRNIFSNKYNKKVRLHLEINDYIHNKDSKLFAFIDKEIEKAKNTGRNMKLPLLNWYERKKVHSYVHKLCDESIKTESRWEWHDRRIFIMFSWNKQKYEKKLEKKHVKLEIDIDWDDI